MCVCLCVNCLCVDCVIVCVCCVAVLFGVALLSMGHRHDYQNSLSYSLQVNNSFCRDCRLAVCHKIIKGSLVELLEVGCSTCLWVLANRSARHEMFVPVPG